MKRVIVLLVALSAGVFTALFPYSHVLHYLVVDYYFFVLILTGLLVRKWLLYMLGYLTVIHLVIDAIIGGVIPNEAFSHSVVIITVGLLFYYLLRNQDKLIETQRKIITHLPIGFVRHKIIKNDDGNVVDFIFVDANKAFEKIMKTTIEAARNKTMSELFPDFEDYWYDLVKDVVKTGKSVNHQAFAKSFNIWMKVHVYKCDDAHFNVIIEDVTEQIKLENALRHERNHIENLVASLADIIFHVDTDRRFVSIFGRQLDLIEIRPEEVIGKTVLEVFGEKGRRRDDYYCRALRGETITYRWKHPKKHQDLVFESTVSPMYDENREIIGVAGVARDVTENERLSKQVEHVKNRYESIIDVTRVGAWEYYLDREDYWYSEAFFKRLGYLPRYYVDNTQITTKALWLNWIHPDDKDRVIKQFNKFIALPDNDVYEDIFRIKKYDGSYAWIFARAQMLSAQKEVVIATFTDITDLKQTEQALKSEVNQTETTLMTIKEAVITTDEHGVITRFNAVSETLTGVSSKKALNQPFDAVITLIKEDSHRPIKNPVSEALLKSETIEYSKNTLLRDSDKNTHIVSLSAAPIKIENDVITGCLVIIRNITEEKQAQREIEYLSMHDTLTKTYNRRYFSKQMQALDKKSVLPLTIVMIDVNGLKLFNDAFGHDVGDTLLVNVAQGLQVHVTAKDTLARIGGDEFALLLPRTSHVQAIKRVKAMEESVSSQKLKDIPLSIAIGFAVKTKISESLSLLFKDAEQMMYKDKFEKNQSLRNHIVQTIVEQLKQSSETEKKHIELVTDYALKIGQAMHLSEEQLKVLKHAAELHDIGKISVNREIIEQSQPLSETQYESMKRHPEIGYQILRSSHQYAHLSDYVLSHHERLDGTGYPYQVTAESIPLYSRIIAVAEAYETMTTEKPYRKPLSQADAITELKINSGTQFDPDIVTLFIEKVLKS